MATEFESAFDALMHDVCVKYGFCGCVREGKQLHVTAFIPIEGVVSADQFVEWVFLADGMDPSHDHVRWRDIKALIRSAFIQRMGGETVEASALRY